jgi:hypothetical protein
MKRILTIAIAVGLACLFGLVFSSCVTAPAGGSFDPNSAIGTWKYTGGDHTLAFAQDFTMVHRDGDNIQVDYGTWKILSVDNKTVQLTWANSENVDTLTVSADGRTLSGTNDTGAEISCIR